MSARFHPYLCGRNAAEWLIDMKQQLEAIRKAALDAISDAGKAEDLEALRVRYLGKKGELTAVLKQMGKLSAEERPVIGQLANDVRAKLEANICLLYTSDAADE